MREPIALPARLVASLRAELTLMLSDAAERVAIVALYEEGPELYRRLGEELWDFDAARRLLGRLRNVRCNSTAVVGLTFDDHPALVARLLGLRLEKERQRAEDRAACGGESSSSSSSPSSSELIGEIERFLTRLSDQLTGSARVRHEEAHLDRRPPARPRPSPLLVPRREETGKCR